MPPKKSKKPKKKQEEAVVEKSEYANMSLEVLDDVLKMLSQTLEKQRVERNYVQLERDSIQQYYDITRREVHELELAIQSKEGEMELLEDNHRVELRVYQQKVKHLEYEHRNNINTIEEKALEILSQDQSAHQRKEKELLKEKERRKFEKMERELQNAKAIEEYRKNFAKQTDKLRSQLEDGLVELRDRCERRLNQLKVDLDLKRRVEVHEIEERKNQHINDLIKNHKRAFDDMKGYYNMITEENLQLIKQYQKQLEELRERVVTSEKKLQDFVKGNEKLSDELNAVKRDISVLQSELKERLKDQMALKNAKFRKQSVKKECAVLKQKCQQLEAEYNKVERERDQLYNSFEDSVIRVQQQSEFQNKALEQRLKAVEANAEKTSLQVEEIIQAANLDTTEMARVMTSLNQMLAAKDQGLKEIQFVVLKLKKSFNDSLETYYAKMKDLGISEEDIMSMGFYAETVPVGVTTGPSGLV